MKHDHYNGFVVVISLILKPLLIVDTRTKHDTKLLIKSKVIFFAIGDVIKIGPLNDIGQRWSACEKL